MCVISKSWVAKYLQLTLWDQRLESLSLSLSLLSYVWRRIRDGEHELWRSWFFAWSDWDTGGSSYPCLWTSIPCFAMWHFHLLCELSHTLYFMLTSNMEFVLMLTWPRSMYYNCSILLLVWAKFVEIYSMMRSLVILLVFSSMDLIIVHIVLVQKRERGFMSMLWLWPMFALSWCSFPCRHDLQLDGFYPCCEMSCCGGSHFSCCGTCLVSHPCLWATCGLCLWSLMIILALVAFVPRPYVHWLALLSKWSMLVLRFI
jgi:hypothetical protein